MPLINHLKRTIGPLFPQAIVYNQSTHPIYIVIDCTIAEHASTAHSIVVLPPKKNTFELGIQDPEGIITKLHLKRDTQNIIWAPLFTALVKTPAGSHVWVHEASDSLVTYTHKGVGLLGHIARLVRIAPSIKDTNRFSNGRFVPPLSHSILREAYDALAQSLPAENP